MGSDSALYMTLGRNLAEGLGYTLDGSVNRLVYPGLPWVLACLNKATGMEPYFAATLVMLALGLIALALVYRLFYLHTDRATAVCITCLTGITYTFYHYAFEILSDMLFCVGVMSVLAGYEGFLKRCSNTNPRSHYATGLDYVLLATGLLVAVAARPTMWVLCASLFTTSVVCLIVGSHRLFHTSLITGMIACVVGILFVDPRWSGTAGTNDAASNLPGYEHWLLMQLQHIDTLWHTIITDHIPKFFEPHLAEAIFGFELGPGINTVAGLLILGLGVHLCRYRLLWGMWFMMMIGTMLIAEPAVRYTLPLIPLVAFAWWQAVARVEHWMPTPRGAQIAVLMLLLWCVPNMVRVGKLIVHQRQIPFLETYKRGRYAPLVDLGTNIHNKLAPDAVIVSEYAYELGYLSRRKTIYSPLAQDPKQFQDSYLINFLGTIPAVYLAVVHSGPPQTPLLQSTTVHLEEQFTAKGSRSRATLYRVVKTP